MKKILSLSMEMRSMVSASTFRSFSELVKMDHLIFKFEAYRVLMGVSDKSQESFPDEHSCRLGLWYYEGETQERFSGFSEFRDLEASHHLFHESVQKAMKAFQSKNAPEITEQISRMEQASLVVLELLEKISVAGEMNPSIFTKT
ncbi:MAG: CZB domain-containing protein [Leptospirales bacterium]